MHTFQPYPMNMLEWNPWEKISKEWLLITTEADGKADAMTASWGGIGHIWNKNVAMVFVRDSRFTREQLDNSEKFSCCFLDPNEKGTRATLKYMGQVSGRDEDKIANARLSVNHQLGAPFIDESNFAIICKKMAKVPIEEASILIPEIIDEHYANGDYHYMYIGEIIDVLAR